MSSEDQENASALLDKFADTIQELEESLESWDLSTPGHDDRINNSCQHYALEAEGGVIERVITVGEAIEELGASIAGLDPQVIAPLNLVANDHSSSSTAVRRERPLPARRSATVIDVDNDDVDDEDLYNSPEVANDHSSSPTTVRRERPTPARRSATVIDIDDDDVDDEDLYNSPEILDDGSQPAQLSHQPPGTQPMTSPRIKVPKGPVDEADGATQLIKVTCKIRCTIISLGQIDTIRQEFWAEVYLSVQWREDTLSGKTGKEVDWGNQWDPKVYFLNAMTVDSQKRWQEIVDNDDGSTDVKLSIWMKATFKTSMKLEWFPFDYQELTIELMSDLPIQYVEFVNDRSIRDRIRKDTFTDRHEWILHDQVIAEPVREMKEAIGSIHENPHYRITAHVQRKHKHFLWNIVLIMFLINALSFTSFTIPLDSADKRFSVTIALLLTAVAYKFIVNTKLPMISYLTLLDKYVLWCLTLHTLMVIQNAVAVALSGMIDNGRIVDYASLAILVTLAVVVNGAFLTIGLTKAFEATSKMEAMRIKYDKIYETTANSGPKPTDADAFAMEIADVSFTQPPRGHHST